jgi:hypothetical protein
MKLAKQAETIAVGKLTKDRIKDSIETLEDMKERELSQAIAVLRAIKDAYEQACRQIDKQVEEFLMEQILIMEFSKWDELKNRIKVQKIQMKRNCLAWDKVCEIIREAIPPQNIDKIKRASNAYKISKYKSLVEFVLSEISNPYKSRIAYINYWETPKRTTRSQSDFEFAPNAWWILGGLGAIMDLLIYHGLGGFLIGAIIGLIITGIIHNPSVLVFPVYGALIGLFWGSEGAVSGAVLGGIIAILALLYELHH